MAKATAHLKPKTHNTTGKTKILQFFTRSAKHDGYEQGRLKGREDTMPMDLDGNIYALYRAAQRLADYTYSIARASEPVFRALERFCYDCIDQIILEMVQDIQILELEKRMMPKRKWPRRAIAYFISRRRHCAPSKTGREIRAPTCRHRAFYHRETIKPPDCM